VAAAAHRGAGGGAAGAAAGGPAEAAAAGRVVREGDGAYGGAVSAVHRQHLLHAPAGYGVRRALYVHAVEVAGGAHVEGGPRGRLRQVRAPPYAMQSDALRRLAE